MEGLDDLYVSDCLLNIITGENGSGKTNTLTSLMKYCINETVVHNLDIDDGGIRFIVPRDYGKNERGEYYMKGKDLIYDTINDCYRWKGFEYDENFIKIAHFLVQILAHLDSVTMLEYDGTYKMVYHSKSGDDHSIIGKSTPGINPSSILYLHKLKYYKNSKKLKRILIDGIDTLDYPIVNRILSVALEH